MKKEQVKTKIASLVTAMREESELRSQLLAINFVVSSEKELDAAMKKQTDLIKGLETLRAEKILPVVAEMAAFVGAEQARRKKPAAPAGKGAAVPGKKDAYVGKTGTSAAKKDAPTGKKDTKPALKSKAKAR